MGKDTVDLSKANVQSMSVDIRKERKTICPREQVQMAVFADVILEGDKDKKSLETWAGRGSVNKNDKMDFVDFAFHSDQGEFDKDGWFAPTNDLLATTDKEFEIKSVFKRQPDKFSFTTKYKPDYQCIQSGGKGGQAGPDGSSGSSGESGKSGQSGSDSQAGGSGSSGGQGSPGSDGGNGGAGPHITAFATMVKTPFYDKLVAIKLTGDAAGPAPGARRSARDPPRERRSRRGRRQRGRGRPGRQRRQRQPRRPGRPGRSGRQRGQGRDGRRGRDDRPDVRRAVPRARQHHQARRLRAARPAPRAARVTAAAGAAAAAASPRRAASPRSPAARAAATAPGAPAARAASADPTVTARRIRARRPISSPVCRA